jgi:hypothetical protein
MTQAAEQRRAPRIAVNLPAVIEKIGGRSLPLHPILVPIYERVQPDSSDLGLKFPGVIRDLSTNGCFITGMALPLLSRVAFAFQVAGFGQVDTVGWVLWRRREDAQLPAQNGGGQPLLLKAGFGCLFEAISLDARLAIARLVAGDGHR